MTSPFKDRLIKALRENNVPEHGQSTWLAKGMGVTPKAANKWINGESVPSQTKWNKLAELLNTTRAYFYEGTEIGEAIIKAVKEPEAEYQAALETWDSNTPLLQNEVNLPFFQEVEAAAGTGQFEVREHQGMKLRFAKSTLQRYSISPENAACIKVKGNSMEPVLPDGSTVGIDTGNTSIIDGKMFALDHDGMLRIKMLYRLPGGGMRLRSYNSDEHPDETYNTEESQHIRIIGRVFWSSVLY